MSISFRYSRFLLSSALFLCLLTAACSGGSTPDSELEAVPIPDPSGPPPDGMVLIRGGRYTIGSNDGSADERPAHVVLLDPFYIDINEVTNAEYTRFVEATGYQAEGPWMQYAGAGRERHPVVAVTWNDAVAYATWAGKRLPTESEWEAAARGGLDGKSYPTGDSITATDATFGVSGDTSCGTSPVGSHPANGFGIHDMAGNAWEWCSDYYALDAYSRPAARNPTGPERGAARVLRGGSWNDHASDLRVANRLAMTPTLIGHVIGFRCGKGVEAEVPGQARQALLSSLHSSPHHQHLFVHE